MLQCMVLIWNFWDEPIFFKIKVSHHFSKQNKGCGNVSDTLGTQKTLHTSFLDYSSCEALHELLSTRIPKLGCAEDGRFGPGCGSSKPTTATSRRSPGVQTKETKEETRTTPKQPSVGTMVRGFGLALVSVRMPRSLMRSVLD